MPASRSALQCWRFMPLKAPFAGFQSSKTRPEAGFTPSNRKKPRKTSAFRGLALYIVAAVPYHRVEKKEPKHFPIVVFYTFPPAIGRVRFPK